MCQPDREYCFTQVVRQYSGPAVFAWNREMIIRCFSPPNFHIAVLSKVVPAPGSSAAYCPPGTHTAYSKGVHILVNLMALLDLSNAIKLTRSFPVVIYTNFLMKGSSIYDKAKKTFLGAFSPPPQLEPRPTSGNSPSRSWSFSLLWSWTMPPAWSERGRVGSFVPASEFWGS